MTTLADVPIIKGKKIGPTGEYQWVNVDDLHFDKSYQRHILQAHLLEMEEKFDVEELGAIDVSLRNHRDNRMYVIDGQHRVTLIKRMGGDFMLRAFVRKDLTPEQEARIFWRAQANRRGLHPLSSFRAQLRAKDATAQAINKAVKEGGLLVADRGPDYNSQAYKTKPGEIQCIGQIRKVFERRGPDFLTTVCSILSDAWPEDGVRATAFQGVAILLSHFDGQVDYERLIKVLKAKVNGVQRSQQTYEDEARMMKRHQPGALPNYVALIMTQHYDLGLPSGSGRRLGNVSITLLSQAYRKFVGEE